MKIQFDNINEAITYADDATCALKMISGARMVRNGTTGAIVDDAVVEAGIDFIAETIHQALSDIQEKTTMTTLEAVS